MRRVRSGVRRRAPRPQANDARNGRGTAAAAAGPGGRSSQRAAISLRRNNARATESVRRSPSCASTTVDRSLGATRNRFHRAGTEKNGARADHARVRPWAVAGRGSGASAAAAESLSNTAGLRSTSRGAFSGAGRFWKHDAGRSRGGTNGGCSRGGTNAGRSGAGTDGGRPRIPAGARRSRAVSRPHRCALSQCWSGSCTFGRSAFARRQKNDARRGHAWDRPPSPRTSARSSSRRPDRSAAHSSRTLIASARKDE